MTVNILYFEELGIKLSLTKTENIKYSAEKSLISPKILSLLKENKKSLVAEFKGKLKQKYSHPTFVQDSSILVQDVSGCNYGVSVGSVVSVDGTQEPYRGNKGVLLHGDSLSFSLYGEKKPVYPTLPTLSNEIKDLTLHKPYANPTLPYTKPTLSNENNNLTLHQTDPNLYKSTPGNDQGAKLVPDPHRCRNLMASHGEYKVWRHRDDPREFYTCAICHPSPVNPANLIFKTIRNHVSNN